MASTAKVAQTLQVVGTSLHGEKSYDIAVGRTALSTGTVNVATGLRSVDFFFATSGEAVAATKHLLLQVNTDLPVVGGTVTVKGLIIDDDETTLAAVLVAATSEVFNWFALGSR